MKAEELRRGNWIITCAPNMPIMIPHIETQVQGITLFGEIIVCHTPQIEGFSMPAKHTMGIPLTEEWLVKFGLINSNGFFKWHRSAIYKGNEKWIYGILGDDNNSYYHVSELHYVHQLQNLYFALTGEELTIKEI